MVGWLIGFFMGASFGFFMCALIVAGNDNK